MPKLSLKQATATVMVGLVLGAVALVVGASLAGGTPPPPVDPPSYSATLASGSSVTIKKTINTPAIPPKPDIVFLSDTTGSMGGAITNVKTNVGSITSTVVTAQPTAQFGVAQYKDGDPPFCPSDPFAFKLDQAVTASAAAVQTAVNTWTASGGCDAPESQLYALHQLATNPSVGWRSGSTRIIAWFGDAPGHDPALGISEAAATSALVAAGIQVIAVNVSNLNATGQATRITAATGGVLLPASGNVSAAILSGLQNLPVTVTPVPTCDPGLTATYSPATQTVTSGTAASFDETLTVAPNAVGVLNCTVDFLLNGNHVDGFQQNVTITAYGVVAGGSFVIGDKNAAVGTAVTFWGAQWWKLNSLTGGAAPAAFKGFENSVSPPACGVPWTTDPGNSPPPPAGPLPAYMAVVVSSSIGKSGSTISGDTVKVVIVKTNPGYDANPGHAGTGTVIAKLCGGGAD